MQDDIIAFIRRRDYRFVRELGQGACGRTVLLYDDQIDEHFVCKKFTPYSEGSREALFSNFVREVKLLYQVYHENVVRVFSHYLYPEELAGFILMEFVDGSDVGGYLSEYPERINELFLQAISGFRYLEMKNVLHRDIRPRNLMVRTDGIIKIIDFGFGKWVEDSRDFEKSLSLNWWCEPPKEFSARIYDFRSEVYFVGKLFERIIQDNGINHFQYEGILGNMCRHDPHTRFQSFADVEKEIQGGRIGEIGFTHAQVASYQEFADCVIARVTGIESEAEYESDVERIQTGLHDAYRSFMLEETAPDPAAVIRWLVSGNFQYLKRGFPVGIVKEFLDLLKSSSPEMKRIILLNLHTRLDQIPRYEPSETEENLPF